MDLSTLRFGTFEIHRDEKLLRRAGEPVPLPPKAVETLLRLTAVPGQLVTKEELMAAVWPDVVVEENNLTQQISILRKTFGPEANGDGWIQTVPKRGYRFTAPIVVPQEKRAGGVARAPRLALYAPLAAVLVLVGLGIMLASFARQPDEIRNIAVLPIQPLTVDEDLSAVGLGISDAVVQRLSYSPEVSVLPMASMRQYIAKAVDPLTIGREVNVDAVVAGTIQRDGNRYRVTMELIDVRTNRSRWSVKVEESAGDVFRLQDLVAEATLRSMPEQTASSAAVARPRRTPVPAAHEAFLKGRYYSSRRTGNDVEVAVAELERAVAADELYADAWAALASAINLQVLHFINEPSMTIARARSAARQAALLDPDLAEAHAALGFISFYYDWNWREGEQSFRRAIELDPANGDYRRLLSNLLIATGRADEAIAEIERAVKADPGSLMVKSVSGRQYHLAGQSERAVEILKETLARDSTFAAAHMNLEIVYTGMGRHEEAIFEALETIRLNPGAQQLAHAAHAAACGGRRKEAEQYLVEANRVARNGAIPHYDFAVVNVALGNYDAAFDHLEAAIAGRYSGMVWLKIDPRLKPIHSDPRYQAMLARMGLSF